MSKALNVVHSYFELISVTNERIRECLKYKHVLKSKAMRELLWKDLHHETQ